MKNLAMEALDMSHAQTTSADNNRATAPHASDMKPMVDYIHHKWFELTRTHAHFYLGMLDDEKVPQHEGAHPIMYVSRKEDAAAVRENLASLREEVIAKARAGELKKDGKVITEAMIPQIDVRVIPEQCADIAFEEHGLMYLPHPYVVPGGRFNENYGWDSAFIVRGLIIDGNQFDTAKDVVDNQLYSVDHYGMVMNANRSYYMGRSQAPFLTEKVMDIYKNYDKLSESTKRGQSAKEWLAYAMPLCVDYYNMWVQEPYIHADSGLSFYNDLDETPGAEVEYSEKDHYPHALEKLREMAARLDKLSGKLTTYQDKKDAYYTSLYYKKDGDKDALTPLFYRGDRAMRTSGFDPSRRFGFFNVDIIFHLPVCLNTLLYIMEAQISEMQQELANTAQAVEWKNKAELRKKLIGQWLWDAGNDPLAEPEARFPNYRDYQFHKDLPEKYNISAHRHYVFATSFYPMWAGIASKEQAADIVEHVYPKLATRNGLMTSSRETGSQWDAPFAWAPLQVVAVRGLLRYGYVEEALNLAYGFLNTVHRGFAATGKIFEKYDMDDGSHNTSAKVDKGYNINVEGFGWTNAAVLELMEVVKKHGNFA